MWSFLILCTILLFLFFPCQQHSSIRAIIDFGGLPFILPIHKNSTYLFKPEKGEIADQRKEIESGQGQRHKG